MRGEGINPGETLHDTPNGFDRDQAEALEGRGRNRLQHRLRLELGPGPGFVYEGQNTVDGASPET